MKFYSELNQLVPLDPYTYSSINREAFVQKYGDAANKFIDEIKVETLKNLLIRRKRKNVNWTNLIKKSIKLLSTNQL